MNCEKYLKSFKPTKPEISIITKNIEQFCEKIHTKEAKDLFLKLPLIVQCLFLQNSWLILSNKPKFSNNSYRSAFYIFKLFRKTDMKNKEVYSSYSQLKTLDKIFKTAEEWVKEHPLEGTAEKPSSATSVAIGRPSSAEDTIIGAEYYDKYFQITMPYVSSGKLGSTTKTITLRDLPIDLSEIPIDNLRRIAKYHLRLKNIKKLKKSELIQKIYSVKTLPIGNIDFSESDEEANPTLDFFNKFYTKLEVPISKEDAIELLSDKLQKFSKDIGETNKIILEEILVYWIDVDNREKKIFPDMDDSDLNKIMGVKSSGITVESYSEKSFVVRGDDTKLFIEQFKSMNGKYNPNLKGSPGWIFSNKQKDKVSKFLENIGKDEEPINTPSVPDDKSSKKANKIPDTKEESEEELEESTKDDSDELPIPSKKATKKAKKDSDNELPITAKKAPTTASRAKKKYDKEYQKHEEPKEEEATYIYYTSLYRQNPKSCLAITWLTEHGVYDGKNRDKLIEKYKKIAGEGHLIH